MNNTSADPTTLTPPAGTVHALPMDGRSPGEEDRETFPIVGVGSSAGGLNALTRLLAKLPPGTGMAFVLIQHLDPFHESQLPSLLSRSTRIPIVLATDRLEVLPDHIYIITPNTSLAIERGFLRLSPRESPQRPHLSIDFFLRSLANDRPGRAIGVLLSGTGSDGTLGLAAIKATGGITFAQDGSAEHDAMPMNAISHGCVDFVLSAEDIALEIEKIALHGFPRIRAPVSLPPKSDEQDGPDEPLPPEDSRSIEMIIESICAIVGIDFRQYRPTTIKRRITRRLGVLQKTSLGEYATFLTTHPEEAEALVKDLLINVTSFFRDREVFAAFSTIILPALMEHHDPAAPVRIWVPGCSTGQEVYSIAMEVQDFFKNLPSAPPIQIFASDISEWALSKARLGFYLDAAMAEVSQERLSSYFTKEPLGYRIKKSIRDMCVFAKHDVTADTPFSKIDLISCRNVLIYLAPVLQNKVLHTFHFALKPRAVLLLGSVESVGRSIELFAPLNDKLRIFTKKQSNRRTNPTFSILKRENATPMPTPGLPFIPSAGDLQRAADRLLLSRFAPAGVLINDTMDIVQFRGQTQPYLEPAQGEASLNLLTMVPYGVADTLKTAISEARELKAPVRRDHVSLRRGDVLRDITFEVIPLLVSPANAGTFLIIFSEQSSGEGLSQVQQSVASEPQQKEASIEHLRQHHQLRNELIAANDHIQALAEQHRILAEQLRTAHEESSSTSEEFRSTNEELQTAKEEVDATNEELVTVNEELRNSNHALAKTMELTTAIVETMRYPLLVLNADLSIESANLAFLNAFRVTAEHTVGRRIYHLGNGQWDIPELRRLLEDILPNNSAFDDFKVTHDFADIGTRTILVNARRIQTEHPQPRIVLVFADITDFNRIVRDLEIKTEELNRSNTELDQFAAVASHDLQEPLRMMSKYIQLLDRRYVNMFDDQSREFMGFITSAAERMSLLIRAILDYAKLGHEGSGFKTVESEGCLMAAMANLKSMIEDSKAEIIQDSLPKLRCNPEQLTQLFQNLINNALKFRSAARFPKIHIIARESASEWTFSVEDNGVGITADSFDRIFQLFQRLNAAHEIAGTGIGLATCKKIVAHHGGKIWVTSTPDIGSTFHFTLPK